MTSWTQYPNHFRPFTVRSRTPCTISFITRFMSNFNNSGFPTCFTDRGCFRIPFLKSFNITVKNTFSFSFFPMFFYFIRIPLSPFANIFRIMFSATIIRAKPFLTLIWSDIKYFSAISTSMFCDWVWARFPSISCSTFLRTIFLGLPFYKHFNFLVAIHTIICFHGINIQNDIN